MPVLERAADRGVTLAPGATEQALRGYVLPRRVWTTYKKAS